MLFEHASIQSVFEGGGVGSFTKAAELLGYTRPALSQMMTSLERELSIDPPIIRTLAVGHQGPPHPAAGGQGVYR